MVAYAVARRLAQENGWREKALVYLTRGREELLVLEHTDEYADAGVQVPGGGVEPGEEPAEAALRELAEETGLVVEPAPIHLESRLWVTAEAPSRIRHYFWIKAPSDTPDRWFHEVSSGEEDRGMLFWLSFRARHSAGLTSGFGWGSALRRLDAMIKG
ncbi:MAG: NUDIX domain-containing protein [Propionibacteriaceae bacterium]